MIPFIGKFGVLYDEVLNEIFDSVESKQYYLILSKLDNLLNAIIDFYEEDDQEVKGND